MPKDLFSEQSKLYAQFRPSYPQELYEYILSFVNQKEKVWDCATGNGQAAVVLAEHFEKVEATDISPHQISNAIAKKNIDYHVCPAEHTPFADNSFDLITVAQAYHWLDWKKFFTEANRVGKINSVVAIWAYGLMSSEDEELNKLIDHFYYEVIGNYWDAERKYVDEGYQTVEFDFNPLPVKNFTMDFNWTREELIGYISSWSAVRNYIKENNSSPVETLNKDLSKVWNEATRKISFPVFLKMGTCPGL